MTKEATTGADILAPLSLEELSSFFGGAFEAANTATIAPPQIAANRNNLVQLVSSNIFGLNTPGIVAAESQYEQMWAQDVSAMIGYHGTP